MKHRREAKEYFSRTNNEILNKMDLSEFDVSFSADSYAPFLIAEYDRNITQRDIDSIYKLAKDEVVTNVYVQCPSEIKTHLEKAVEAIDGTDVVYHSMLDGTGIVIGILDTGIVDKDNTIFDDVDLEIRDEWWYLESVKDHATQVAACALEVAPGASILSVQIDGHPSGEIGWLIDNGVNVINISYYYDDESTFGKYTSESAYCDYIAREYRITFTIAAGNEGGESKLTTCPNGYNVLTVGSCHNTGIRRGASSYEEKFTINYPNLLAPGSDLTIPTFSMKYSGTSYAAPITAGVVALLMQREPYLTLFPERVMSIIMASTQRIDAYAMSSGFNDEAGTGMLNLEQAIDTIDNTIRFTVSEDCVGNYVSSHKIYLSKGQSVRVAFVSLVNNGESDTSALVTDYDLYLFNSNGVAVESCLSLYNNEFIDYEATSSGYYTIKIRQYSAKKTDETDVCAYAYYIE